MSTPQRLLDSVITPGLCIGCGVCASLEDSAFQMRMTPDGRYQAELREGADAGADGRYLETCPFASSTDEDDLAQMFLDSGNAPRTSEIGTYRATAAGHVSAGAFRADGSSGGMTTWFLRALLEAGEVDQVIHVMTREELKDSPVQATQPDALFAFGSSAADSAPERGAKTRYYPVEMSQALTHIRTVPGRYAIVGLPCFVKGVRLLQKHDLAIRERVRFCVGIVRGHLKSTRFADIMAWEQGITPGTLEHIEFRKKTDTRASNYAVQAVSTTGETVERRAAALLGQDWGAGLFKYRACDFCDDVTNETADIAFGDAWLPGYDSDPAGTNVMIVRSEQAQRMIDVRAADLEVDAITPEEVARSQAAGLRHRREGLAYRLHQEKTAGRAVPVKRVAPSARIPRFRKAIYDARSRLIGAADRAYEQSASSGDFERFRAAIMPEIAQYKAAYASEPITRLTTAVKRFAPGIARLAKRALRR